MEGGVGCLLVSPTPHSGNLISPPCFSHSPPLYPPFTQTIFKELYPCIYTPSIISWAELPLPEAAVRSEDIPET